jgi:hypothetical protein
MRCAKLMTVAVLGMASLGTVAHATDAGPASSLAPSMPVPTARLTPRDARTLEAPASLVMAETRQFAGAVPPESTSAPNADPVIGQIHDALHVLGDGEQGQEYDMIRWRSDAIPVRPGGG